MKFSIIMVMSSLQDFGIGRQLAMGFRRDNRGILLNAGGIEDHIHLLARLPPAKAVSDMLRLVKANSSKWINEIKELKKPFEWQPGYTQF